MSRGRYRMTLWSSGASGFGGVRPIGRARPAGERAMLARFIVSSLAGIALMTFDPGDEKSGAMLGRLALMVEIADVSWVDGGQA